MSFKGIKTHQLQHQTVELNQTSLLANFDLTHIWPGFVKIRYNSGFVKKLSHPTSLKQAIYTPNILTHVYIVYVNYIPNYLKAKRRNCRSIDAGANLMAFIWSELQSHMWAGEEEEVENRIVDFFHANLEPGSDTRILSEFTKPDGNLRCLVSTIAFGMGIGVNDITNVVHWGPAPDVLSYWQEVGRCARDGREGRALLYTPPYSVHKDRIDQATRSLLDSKQCLRYQVLSYLRVGSISDSDVEGCCHGPRCCSFCDNLVTNKSPAEQVEDQSHTIETEDDDQGDI